MNRKQDTAYGPNRIESKNARAAIILKISAVFNLMLLVAEAYYKQISSYLEQQVNVHLTSSQNCYEAGAAEEPASKHIALAKKVSTQRIDLAYKFHISNYLKLTNFNINII